MDKKTAIMAMDDQYKAEKEYIAELTEQYEILKNRFERANTLLITDQQTELEFLKKDLKELREVTPDNQDMKWRGFVHGGLVTLNRNLDSLIADVMKRSAHLSPAEELEQKKSAGVNYQTYTTKSYSMMELIEKFEKGDSTIRRFIDGDKNKEQHIKKISHGIYVLKSSSLPFLKRHFSK